MTIDEAIQDLRNTLLLLYDDREAKAIIQITMEAITHFTRAQQLMHKATQLTPSQHEVYLDFKNKLERQVPVQYVLHEAWFAGMKFYVDENVLIPRPETEELVEWILSDMMNSGFGSPVILDIGTGSGCIPIALKQKLPKAHIHACDISNGALAVARLNASTYKTEIEFYQTDFLNTTSWTQLPGPDILVSNPPYIPIEEMQQMEKHVVDYEPHAALFVPDNDPLVFYKALAVFASQRMKQGGFIYVETHENRAQEVKEIFMGKQLKNVIIREDMQHRTRMIKATVMQ